MGGAGRVMPHDHHVDAHGLDVLGRVDERFALGEAAGGGGEVERVGPQPPGGQPKLVRVRVEFSKKRLTQVLPVSSGILRCPRSAAGLKRHCLIQDQREFFGGKVFQPQQVSPRPGGGHGVQIEQCCQCFRSHRKTPLGPGDGARPLRRSKGNGPR